MVMKPMNNKRVLVVEDHRPNARLLALLVERCGVEAAVAYDGAEALTMILADKPDLILLDLMLPIMTGNDLLKALRADGNLSDIPVVIITTKEEPELGAPYGLPYIRKPFEPAQVQQIVEELLKR